MGSALGDAIGELAFRYSGEARLRSEIARSDILTYTDDTAMAIGLAESIIQVGGLEEQHLGDTFRANFRREPWRGYGAGPPSVFSLVEREGLSYSEAARRLFGGQGSLGNGAAMRIAPLALFFHRSSDLYDMVRRSACVTHAHPVGVDGDAVLARAVAETAKVAPQEPFPFQSFSQGLIDWARTPEVQNKMILVRTLIAEAAPPLEAAKRLGRSVAVQESMPFAICAFMRYPNSFEQCLFCGVLNGGDRDTLGAMACGVSGSYLGIEAIPQAWQDKIENRARLVELAGKLVEMSGEGVAGSATRPATVS